MTAAFDISRSPVGWHSVPLYDPRDPWWKADPRADWAAALGDRLADLFRAHEAPRTFFFFMRFAAKNLRNYDALQK